MDDQATASAKEELEKIQYYDPMYCGTNQYTKYYQMNLCDSVIAFAKEHGAFWLLDIIGSYYPKLRDYPFLILTLDADVPNGKAVFYAQEDTDEPRLIEQEIPFTDVKVSVKMYLIDGALMFPSDY